MKRNTLLPKMLTLLLVFSLIFSACGSTTKAPDTTPDTSTSETSSTAESTPAKSSAAESTQEPIEEPIEEPANLVWYIRKATPNNKESVLEAANTILAPALNATLDLQFINPGDYNEKMQIIMSSGEEFDLCWTAEWANKYDSNAAKGAYLNLDQYMTEEYIPDILAAIPERIWDGVKVNGSVYGIPNLQVMYDQAGLWFRKDMIEKYDLDVEGIKSWDDLTPIYATIREQEENDVFPYRGTIPGTKIESSFTETPATVISSRLFTYNDTTKKVSNDFFADGIDTLKLFRSWYEEGYIPTDAATLQDEVTMYRAGKLFSRYCRIKPGVEAEFFSNNEFEIVAVPIGKKVITTAGVQSTLNAVSVTSKNPERAVRFLNLLYQNSELYNTLVFGIEGQDYERVDATHIKTIADRYAGESWMMGNQFNAYLIEGQADTVWDETIKGNSEAEYDPLMGFILDRSAIETELSSCEAVLKEYEPILLYGLDNPETTLAEMNTKLEAAGITAATEEIQRQVDEFLST